MILDNNSILLLVGLQGGLISIVLGFVFLKYAYLFRAKSRAYVPETHIVKNDTPTMGGLFILASILLTIMCWYRFISGQGYLALCILIGYGIIGFIDDWLKITQKTGMTEKVKSMSQSIIALLVIIVWLWLYQPALNVPLLWNTYKLYFGWLLVPWAMLVVIGSSNAVNLTDGLDGLAAGTLVPNFVMFSILASKAAIEKYYIPTAYGFDIALIASAAAGSCLGFLWYNRYPARLFMGDVGSLALGGLLGFLAILLRLELILLMSSAVFVIETVSVIVQVLWYKQYRVRFFKMAPLHHHFELLGYKETTITVVASLLSSLLAIGIVLVSGL